MPNFLYVATDSKSKETKGSIEAKDALEAKTRLRQSGLCLISIKKENTVFEQLGWANVRNADLAIFSHQFSVMISSGIPLIRALKALGEETANRKLRAILQKVRLDVENGASLSSSLVKHPKIFSNFFITLVKSGEASGTLPLVLNRLASYLEKEEDLRRKVRSAFAYPVIVGIVAFGVMAFLLIFIVPVFKSVYKSLKVGLPGPTVFLIALSNIFVKFWWLVLLVIALIYCVIRIARNNAVFGLGIDRIKLGLPLFGPLISKVAISRFVRTLATMIGSGLTLNSSLLVLKDIVGNRVIVNSLEGMRKDINQGLSISDSLKDKKFFPPIVVQMLSVGEESGNLNSMLDKCADFLDEEIDTVIKGLIVKIEPTLTFFLAVLVGFIAMAIYLPMFDLIRQISR
ncbi:MAG: type II secretion system F family protein [Candidatus Omnitrophota bacterium]